MLKVKIKQLVEDEDLSNREDREDFALGKDTVHEEAAPPRITTAKEALDWYHDGFAIGCLEDYEVWVEDENGNKLQE